MGGPKPLPDVLAPDLDVLFCGINPSLVSAARGHHFARPGNRFWPALHLAGLTPRRFTPEEDAVGREQVGRPGRQRRPQLELDVVDHRGPLLDRFEHGLQVR